MHHTATRAGPLNAALADESRTMTVTSDDSELRGDNDGAGSSSDPIVGALRLRAGPRRRNANAPRVAWEEGTIDNEAAGKKKSKSEDSVMIF